MTRKAKAHRPIPKVLFTFADGKPVPVLSGSDGSATNVIDVMKHAAEREAMAYYLDLTGFGTSDEARDTFVYEAVRKAVQSAFRQMDEPLRQGIDKMLSDHDKGRKDSDKDTREAAILMKVADECERRIQARKGSTPTKEAVARAVAKSFAKSNPGERGYSESKILKVLYRFDQWPLSADMAPPRRLPGKRTA